MPRLLISWPESDDLIPTDPTPTPTPDAGCWSTGESSLEKSWHQDSHCTHINDTISTESLLVSRATPVSLIGPFAPVNTAPALDENTGVAAWSDAPLRSSQSLAMAFVVAAASVIFILLAAGIAVYAQRKRRAAAAKPRIVELDTSDPLIVYPTPSNTSNGGVNGRLGWFWHCRMKR